MATEKIILYDSFKNNLIEVELSAENAIRARNDNVFATKLLNVENESTECYEMEVENSIESSMPLGVIEQDSGGNCYRWTTPCVLLLLETYKLFDHKFMSGKHSQKKVWEDISQILNQSGHNVTGPQCAAKLRSLKKSYKSIKDHNGKSGNDRRTWQFYEIMEDIFCKKAWCAPVALASSSGLSTNKSNKDPVSEPSTSKSSAKSLLLKRLNQKEGHEKFKAERHKERMELLKRHHIERMEMDKKLLQSISNLNNSKEL